MEVKELKTITWVATRNGEFGRKKNLEIKNEGKL